MVWDVVNELCNLPVMELLISYFQPKFIVPSELLNKTGIAAL